MNAKSKIKVLHNDGVIEMNKTFAKMVENPFSEEYAFLQKIRMDYPKYTVGVREIKKNPNKECWKGLTYEYMENYIITHENDENRDEVLKEFAEQRLISECHSKCHRYPVIKKWFLAKYPEIAEFGMSVKEVSSETQKNNVVAMPQQDEEKGA